MSDVETFPSSFFAHSDRSTSHSSPSSPVLALFLFSVLLDLSIPHLVSQPQMDSFDISKLASEILLFIFLHLDLNQLVICRRVSQQFQEVIDNNQLLWRIFEWIQQEQESFSPALEMFDQKSRSSLEKVSVQDQSSEEEDILHLLAVLEKSKETLKEVILKFPRSTRSTQIGKGLELLTTGSRLRSLVVWPSGRNNDDLPFVRLIPSEPKKQVSSCSQLQLLWVYDGVTRVDSKHLNSLISFAQGGVIEGIKCRELISKFSDTIVHLKLAIICLFTARTEPLFCPNLKIFEGWGVGGFSSNLDAPQLRILVLEAVRRFDLEGLPSSVEEIWLRSRSDDLALAEKWEPLLDFCPKLRILKLTEAFVLGHSDPDTFVFTGILEVLEIRNEMAQDGEEIDGNKMVSLERLILPIGKLNEEELERAAEVAEEVIDVKDHPAFIEIMY